VRLQSPSFAKNKVFYLGGSEAGRPLSHQLSPPVKEEGAEKKKSIPPPGGGIGRLKSHQFFFCFAHSSRKSLPKRSGMKSLPKRSGMLLKGIFEKELALLETRRSCPTVFHSLMGVTRKKNE